MRKRVFSILLSIAVCLSMMPVGAWAETAGEGGTATQSSNVAEVKIGETVTQYADITEAFAAAQKADSAEVKLLNNAEITTTNTSNVLKGIELLEGGNITLDLNGKTLSGKQTSVESTASDSILISVYDPCTLTVKDSSGGGAIVQSNSVAAVRAAGAGTLIIDGGTIKNTSSQTKTENCAVLVMGSGNVTINGGTIRGAYRGIYVNSYDSSATLTVTGSPQIHGEQSYALLVGSAKSVTLSGGTFTTNETGNHSIWNSSGTAGSLLAGGYRYEDGAGNQAEYSENQNGVVGKAVVSFVKDEVTYVYTYGTNPGEFKTKTISDFIYIDENTTTLNEGFYVVKGNVTINGDVTAESDNVSIILCDDSNLTINGSLLLPKTATGREVKIYGQKDSSGSMTVTSSDDFAIKYSGENPRVDVAWVNVYGGSLTATGSDKATASSVRLYAGPNMMMKCTDLIKNEPVAKNDLMHIGENTASFRFERCTEHEWKYTNDSENTDSHYKTCSLCSFYGGAETHSASTWTCKDDKHTGYCVCGKEMETEAHDLAYVINSDGLTHSEKCSKCDYAADPETHNFNKTETTVSGVTYSACEKCDAYLIAEYNDEKYASLQCAVNKAAEVGGTVTLAAELVGDEITVTDGNVTIDLNGKKWAMSYVTYIPLTVDGGNVTLKNGKIHQSGSSSDARSAIVVKSGSLTLGSDVSVMGGTSSIEEVRCYSVDLQGGSLTLEKGAALLSGMKVPESHTLSEYLPAGSAFVKCNYTDAGGVQISDPIEYVKDAYTANEYTGAMAVIAHTHKGVPCACGFVCDHSSINEDGYCSQCQMTFEAKNDSTYYESLATALSEAKDGETVTLLKNNVMSADITLGGSKIINLDLNSKGIDSAGETLQSIIIESGATLAVSNTKISSMSSNGKPLVITFEVKSGGMLDLCPDGYVVDATTYRGTVSCVKLAGGGKLRSFGGWISNLELTAPYKDYDVNIMRSTSDCAKINGISTDSGELTVGDVLKKNHAGYVLRGRNSGTGETVPNTTLIKDMQNWTDLYVTECDHGDADADAVCDYCGAALVVKVEARKGDTGVVSIKYFALKNTPNSTQNGYALAISTMNGTLSEANGYTYREMTLLRDADNQLILSGDFTLNGNGKNINGNVDVKSGANIIFHSGSYKGNVYVNGSATVKGFTVFDVGSSVTVGRSGELTTMSNSSFDKMVVSGMLKSKGGNFGSVTFEESSKGELEWGSFSSMEIKGERNLNSLLKGQKAYFNNTTNTVVNGVVTNLSNVYILEHTHKFAGSNSCACGYTCEHEIDSNGVCSKCKTQFAAAVTTGSDTEYVTDIYDAFEAAGNGSTIRLLADTSLDKSFEFTTGDVTLDLNGKALNGKTVTVSSGSKVEITDSVGTGSIASIAANGGTLNITGGNVKKLDVKKAENISISGGSFGSIVNSTGEYFNLGVLLADGYAFKQGETFKKRKDTIYKDATIENLTIAQCVDGEHDSMYSSDGYICAYCNKKIVAGIGNGVTKHYADLGNAIADADCNEYRAVTISRDITIDKPIIISKQNNSMNTLYIDLQNHTVRSGAGFSGSMFTVKDGYIAFKGSSGGSIEAADTDGITVTGGSLEVESGSIVASGEDCAAIRLKGGKLNVSTGSVDSSGNAYAVIAEDGDELLIKADKSFGKLKIAATYAGSMLLRAGIYSSIETADGKFKTVNDLLTESYGFADADTGIAVDGNTTKVENVKIVHHHIYDDDGLCTAGGDYYWAQAKVTGTGDSNTDRFYDTLEEALQTAEEHAGCRVTVWSNAEPKNTVTVSKGEFTIDFRHNLGSIRGFYSDWIGSLLKIAGGNIEITGAHNCGIFSQGKGNTALEISGGTVTVTGGCFKNNPEEDNNIIDLNGGTLILKGGTFINYAGAVFKTAPADYGSLLGTGYAYADADGNLMKPADMRNDIDRFKVVECTDHQPDADGRCIYCEEKCVAELVAGETVTKYIDLNKAFEAAKANEGAAVKLLDNITGGASSDGSLTLDLNGKTVDKVEITDGTLTVSGSGNINALNIKNGTLDISNNGVRISALTAAENGKAALTAGTFGSISVSEGRSVTELLAPEYSYKIGEGWASIEQREADSLTGDITVALTPITGLTVTADKASVIYGYKTAPKITAVPVLADGKTASYKWYRITGDTVEEISGAADAEYTVPYSLAKGTYTYRCEVTADGYTLSEEVTVTVNEKVIDSNSASFKLNSDLTYNGSVQEPDFTITVDGRELVKDKDYSISFSSEVFGAGEYTATVTGKGNYSGSADTLFTVAKKQIAISNITVSPKTYDGSKAADITEVVFDGLVAGETLEKGTDYTVTGEFNSADVNDADKVSATVKLADSVKNYELTDGSFNKTASIAKADAQCTAPKAVADLVYTGEAQGLVTAGSSEHGDMVYSLEQNGAYSSDIPTAVNAGDYNVWYKVIGDDNHNDSNPVSVKVTVNRADAVFEMPAAVIGLVYTGEDQELVTAGSTEHGDMVYSLEQDGTYTTAIPAAVNAGAYKVWYKVKGDGNHKDSEPAYVEVSIAKATPTGAPAYDRIGESGKTLADAKLDVKDKDGKDKFSVEGSVKWADNNTTEVKQGEKYKWTFTPTDTVNYNTLTGEITLWPYSSGGGGIMPAPSTEVTTGDKTGQSGEKVTSSPSEVKNETKTDENGKQITTAKITVSTANQKEILKQAKENKSGEIIIKVSEKDVKDGAKLELALEKDFIEDILNDTDADLTIQTPDGEKTFTQKELKKLVEAATGSTITLDPAASTNPSEPTNPTDPSEPTTPSTGKNAKLIKGVQNTTIILKSKLMKSGKIRLTWTKSKGYKLDRFEIYRSVKKNSGYGKKAFFTTKDGSSSKYLNTKSLKKGKAYYYKLRGVRIIGGKKYYTKWSNKTWRTVK